MASHSSNGSTQIGRGTTIRGSVRGSGEIDIDGRIEGVVDVDGDVTLSESARVRIEEGSLSGRRVSVRGAVSGNIRGNAAIVLEDGARVVGDLAAPTIGIRPGGLLRGHVSTGDAPESQALTKGRAAARDAERAPAARAARPAATSSGRGRGYGAAPAPRASSAGAVATQRTAEPAPSKATYEEPVTPAPARGSKREAAPAPVMPVLRKGQRGSMKRKNGR